ncbi:MAG: C-type lectin domain-containing protein, partial [Planctomycetia bacterium]|nr:C-type lectin domain-containing protein [Planctomycetia bacterium]
PEAPTGKRAVQTAQIRYVTQTIDVVVGYRQVAGGVVYTPIVTWVNTKVEMQTGVQLVRNGSYNHTMDVTLTQDGYYNGIKKREYFIHGVDYANSLADVTVDAFGNNAYPYSFTGAPDDRGENLNSYGVFTYNFTESPITNKTGGDFNLYQTKGATGSWTTSLKVEVSYDGSNFFDVTATASDPIEVTGASNTSPARSYDIEGTPLSAVRYIKLTSTSSSAPFFLDAIGARIVNPNQVPVIDWAGDTPVAGSTFNQLTQSQREIVVATLGYKPLYDFSYTNAKEYRTQNGSSSVVNWTPYWSTAAKHIVEINSPGLENRYIRLPIDAEMDINRSVSQGAPTTFAETVGSYFDRSNALYTQDKSRYVGYDDLDQSGERFAVTYLKTGRRIFYINDGFEGTLVADPAWASSVDTQVGFDGYGQQVLAPLGYLADLRYASGGSVVSSRGDVIVLNSAYHPDLGQWSNLYYGPTVLEWVSAIAEWFTARDNSRARGGYLASINSYQEWQWAQRIIGGQHTWIGLFYPYTTWDSGEPVTFTAWSPGQPDGNHGGVWCPFEYGGWDNISYAGQAGIYGYLLERPATETFYTKLFQWGSKYHDIVDTRLTLSSQWVGNAHDLYTEIPVVELVDAKVPITKQVASTSWVSQPITDTQTIRKPVRDMVSAPAVDYAVFTAESLKADSSMIIDAGRDVSLSGLVTAKNSSGTAGSITIDAGRDFLMSGAKPQGASAESLAAVAGMTAVSNIAITTGRDFTLAESINISANDGNATTSTANKLVVTATDKAIIRGTLSTTNTKIGEVTVNAGDDIELKGEIVAGHVANIFAGTDGVGGISSDIQGHIKTLGS